MRRLTVVSDLCCFFLPSVLLLLFPDIFADAVRNALTRCAMRVIPAVFPFIAATRFLAKRGVTERLGMIISPVLSPLLGVPPSLCGAVLLGLIAGFPNGAAVCADVYQKGYCTKRQAERAAALCGNASAPFVLFLAGQGVCGDVRRGYVLFGVQIAVCLLYARIRRGDRTQTGYMTAETMPFSDAAAKAIREAAAVTLSITGFIVFFSMCGATAGQFINGSVFRAAVLSLCEITSGLDACTVLNGTARFAAAAFAVGFCGLSAHFQVASALHDAGLSCKEYMAVRLLSAVILPLSALIPIAGALPVSTAFAVHGTYTVYASLAALAAMLAMRAASEKEIGGKE